MVLINERGKQAVCGSVGFGAVGAGVAMGSYMTCVDRHKALGFVDLSEFEKGEPAKIEQRPGITPPRATAPAWRVGDAWTFQLSGVARGRVRQEVLGKDAVDGIPAYVVAYGNRRMLLSEELNPIQVREGDSTLHTHRPPVRHYTWPLEVGTRWQAEGTTETLSGKLRYTRDVEVKGYGIVQVPAGAFEAFYLLVSSRAGLTSKYRLVEIWYAPKARYYVKFVTYDDTGRTIWELVEFSEGPG